MILLQLHLLMFCVNYRVNVGALIAYHLSLSDDLDDLYLAELEDDLKLKRNSKESTGTVSEVTMQSQSKIPL